jgi:exodeoxyribonuclease VII large subunit
MNADTPLPPSPQRDIYSISRLNREAKALLEASFPLIWVEGEISNLARPASGHLYFSLKDEQAQVRCALFRGNLRQVSCTPRDGMQVLIRARVSLYEGRGDFQLIVNYMEEAGEGALRRAFEALKNRLAREGLFAAEHKQALPVLPSRIGVITSPSGAALRDILSTLKRRFPAIPVRLYPVPVQGEGAGEKIAAAVQLACHRADCDVLILARGGGSLEDLWAFNEEVVARAVHDCSIPIVCGVGHEVDYSIADLVADQRAPTPTAAAELVSPDSLEWLEWLERQDIRLRQLAQARLLHASQRLDWTSRRLVHPRQRLVEGRQRLTELGRRLDSGQRAILQTRRLELLRFGSRLQAMSPAGRLATLGLRLKHLNKRLEQGMNTSLQHQQRRLELAMHALNSVSPLATLERGYAITRRLPGRELVRDHRQVAPGDRIETTLARGVLISLVEKIDRD